MNPFCCLASTQVNCFWIEADSETNNVCQTAECVCWHRSIGEALFLCGVTSIGAEMAADLATNLNAAKEGVGSWLPHIQVEDSAVTGVVP